MRNMPHEVTVIKGRRFSDLPALQGHQLRARPSARHVGKIDHLEEAHAPAQ